MYSPLRAYIEFTAFLEEYERDHAPDEQEDMLFPLYIPASIRRRMITVLRHPTYSAMLCESIRGVDREIMFIGSADVESSGEDDAAGSVTGDSTGGEEDGVSSGGEEGSSEDSGVVDWVSGSDGLFYGVHGNMIVGVEERENDSQEEEENVVVEEIVEDIEGKKRESVVDAVDGDPVDGDKVGDIVEEGGSGVKEEKEGKQFRSRKRSLPVSSDEEDVTRNMYCLPKDQLTWEQMFDAVESLNLTEFGDTDEEEMSEISEPTDDEE